MKKILLFLLLMQSLYPCKWCDKWKKTDTEVNVNSSNKTTKQDGSVDEVVDKFEDNGIPQDILNDLRGMLKQNHAKEISKQNSFKTAREIGEGFYKAYLSVYYPRAYVIIDHFFEMCPVAIESALDEVVSIVTDKPWFYFKNKPDGFRLGEYWESILDQYDTISKFLSRALIDKRTNKLELDDPRDFRSMDKNKVPLVVYWMENGIDSFYKFHAHHCDYLVKMFNEGIKTEDYKQAKRYSYLFRRIVNRLQNSKYESEYQEKLKDNEWLLGELKKRLDQRNK